LTTLFLGWWGMISFVLTPFILINNVYRYFSALSLPAPDASAIALMNSPMTNTPIAPPQTGFSKFKIIYGAIVCIVALGYLAYNRVEFLEKHAPALNAVLHQGEITDESDSEYAGAKIGHDIAARSAPIKSKEWNEIRTEFLSREATFIDLKTQSDKLQSRMAIERDENLGKDDVCEELSLTKFGPALAAYTAAFEQEFTAVKKASTLTAEFVRLSLL
jgi:hypothetical protein